MIISSKNKVLRVLSLMTALILLFGLAGCGKNSGGIQTLKLPAGSLKDVYPVKTVKYLHVTDSAAVAEQNPIVKSGFVSLYLDMKTYTVAVKEVLDDDTDKWWYTLPALNESAGTGYDYSAAAATLQVVSGNKTIYLNSQDNSVAYGKASVKAGKTGLTLTYVISPDAATANKKVFDAADIAYSVSIHYTLEASSLNVSCSYKNLSGNTNAKIEYLGLMEFFGASGRAKAGDFILVPDGCGALIDTAQQQDNFKPLKFEVYGNDAGSAGLSGENVYSAPVAAYGIKQGESGLAVIIRQGAALASITADRSTGTSGCNKIGTVFNLTPVYTRTAGGKIIRSISGSSFGEGREENLSMCFRFVKGSGADYSGIASVCREQLLRDEVLSTKIVETSDYLPFNLTVIGAARKKMFNFGPMKKMEEYTTFEQAQDMLVRMKSKGINNINLRYKGALSGGLNQSDISEAGLMRSLGGKSGYNELGDYMAAQKMNLYLDINLLSSRKKVLFNESKSASTLAGEKAVCKADNEFYPFALNAAFINNLRRISGLDNTVLKALTEFRNSAFSGFCFNDAGTTLFSDYSGNSCNREDAAEKISAQIRTLAMNRKIMVDTGNFNAVKNADVIVNMPLETSVKASASYRPVPFIQLIMHGIADYSGKPVNLSSGSDLNGLSADDLENNKNIKIMMLKYIEYGACPCYEWCYKELEEGTDVVDTFYYEDWLAAAVKYYSEANETLQDLRNSRMVSHSMVAQGVYCTEYEGNTLIYVNYTDKDYAVDKAGGFTVKANDFIRIN